MGKKIRVNITGMTINAPTYKNVAISPTMINFFYGKNGTGKSTLAKAFKDGNAKLEWDGQPYPENRILVYNEDFITKNVQSYGNIPGVFTISEVNAQKKKEADEKTAEKKAVDDEIKSRQQEISAADQERSSEEANYREAVWKLSAEFREKFPSALAYLRDKKKFVGKVESMCPKQKKSSGTYYGYDEEDMCFSSPDDEKPELISIEEIQKLYDTVYSKTEQPKYSDYKLVSGLYIPASPLLAKPIISQSDTDFARFIRALGNLDWITAGHEKYHTEGICPYCQRELPATFEQDLAACYDRQYREEISALQKYVRDYKDAMNNIYVTASGNYKNPFPTNFKNSYQTKYDLFMEKARANVAVLDRKLATPSEEVEIEDISPLLEELDEIAADINDDINSRREVLSDIPKQRQRCSEMVWQAIWQRAQVEINTYRHNEDNLQKKISELNKTINDLRSKSNTLTAEIAKLNSETVNTTKAMEDINSAIRNAGFKGFFLREKPGAKYVYQLVRDFDGKQDVVNKNLSEGERHFIAFLYFYHMVMGSQSDEGKVEDKIVVIDDPVSSMDSSSLFVVAALVREMVAVCYNNYELHDGNKDEHIRQFFCLTHNPFFFREISFNRLADYECVSFFEIKKNNNNQTSIDECDEDDKLTGGGKINRSPVRNNYDSLWHEYATTESPDTLMLVARQILEYYFIQMVGYQNINLRKELLGINEDQFIRKNEDGSLDRSDYVAATAMIAMLNVGATGFNDGLYYDSSAADITQLRSVFKRIFHVMGQDQHYDMMTRRQR